MREKTDFPLLCANTSCPCLQHDFSCIKYWECGLLMYDINYFACFVFILQNDDLRLVTRERDELQSMLDRFEKHMIEIQSNVKLLTAERDKLSILYEQVCI